jgi:hypothetical protein
MRARAFRASLFGAAAAALLALSCKDSAVAPTPRCVNPIIANPSGTILELRDCYQQRSYERFAAFFSSAPDGAPYVYVLDQPAGATWDRDEELRIQRRMFRPEDPLPGESTVPQELWLASIDIQLLPQTDWSERPDLLRSASNPTGLDPARWRAYEAVYDSFLYFKTQGSLDYQVNGRASFVVVEDRRQDACQGRKYFIFRWQDLGTLQAPALATEQSTWTSVKQLYR